MRRRAAAHTPHGDARILHDFSALCADCGALVTRGRGGYRPPRLAAGPPERAVAPGRAGLDAVSMSAEQFFFSLFAVGAVLGCLGVVLLRNPVNAAQSLIASFFCLAGQYVLLHAHLLAVLQILVYAGAVMVLFLFVLMLLNIGDDEVQKRRVGIVKLTGVAALGSVMLAVVVSIVGSAGTHVRGDNASVPDTFGKVEAIGRELMTRWVLPFELVGVLLLAGIVGAVVVAKRRF
jgi:NADH-quinone oxidoreductase subunit J